MDRHGDARAAFDLHEVLNRLGKVRSEDAIFILERFEPLLERPSKSSIPAPKLDNVNESFPCAPGILPRHGALPLHL
jgi:hypothetical protein